MHCRRYENHCLAENYFGLACLEFIYGKIKMPTCKSSLVTKDYSLSEVEADLGPLRTATVYYRAISGAETGLGCAAFPAAAFGTATDPRRCYYSGYPWRRGHRNTAIPVDTCNTERSVVPVPMVNSGRRSVGTTQNT